MFGGRRIDADTVQYTDFDHNDANGLGTAILTPQDPLFGVDDLAQQVRAAGITTISGDVVVDDRLFIPYRVPNGNLLITPMMLNENMVDVTVTPTIPGHRRRVEYRPQTEAFAVEARSPPPSQAPRARSPISDEGRIQCIGTRRMRRHRRRQDSRRLPRTAQRCNRFRRHVPGRGSRRVRPHRLHRGARATTA